MSLSRYPLESCPTRINPQMPSNLPYSITNPDRKPTLSRYDSFNWRLKKINQRIDVRVVRSAMRTKFPGKKAEEITNDQIKELIDYVNMRRRSKCAKRTT